MVGPSMSPFFKRFKTKINPEITPGICPHCDMPTSFVSIVNDLYKCMTCGQEVEQKINGVIKYLPVGSESLDKEHGT